MDSTRARRGRCRPVAETLESRELLSTITVSNLHARGAGSLRQAIVEANRNPGPDTIDFSVAGTIHVGRRSLPAIKGTVNLDGTSAPGFAGSPVVTLNFSGSRGLKFAPGSDGSTLRSLSLVRAGGAGVTLSASHITVQGNDIGVMANGKTVAGNRGDGIKILASSHGDLIGQLDPVTGVTYYNSDSVLTNQKVNGWQGIRDGFSPGQYLITGTAGSNGLLYVGPISGVGGTSYDVNYPGATSTSVYGPDIVKGNVIRLVGSYKTGNGMVNGFMFEGTVSGLSNPANYRTIDYPNSNMTDVHSTAGDLAVGNGGAITPDTNGAFLYNISQNTTTDIVYPGSATTSAYGIWSNGGSSYTICGGFSMPGSAGPNSQGYLVDYNSATGQFSNWTAYAASPGVGGVPTAMQFQGISSPVQGIYTLSANITDATSSTPLQAELATVRRNPDGTFSPAYYVSLNDPGSSGLGTNESVAGNQIVGIAQVNGAVVSYQATVNLGFQLSNVISGNRGNGIGIYGASNNRIAMNNIGTDASGTMNLGNRKDGILLTRGASGNIIGGKVTGGNDPTAGVIVRPPQGNLISGNRGDGVRMTGGAHDNTMSGNFVGTTASGDAPLGNRGDGVAIVRANDNALIGCQFQDQPFVYYNVISGNGGNGLRITNSNNTTVQANFLGAGANNATIVPNHRDGLLVSGHSRNTQVGGVIPLGNVISGNTRNGIEVTQAASGFTSFNTFAGLFAFSTAAPNGRDGILITSRGGNNLIRTCIVSGNIGNGIELGGRATGVQITDTAAGTNTAINAALPNGGDGLKIDGHAHGNAIGGFQPSVEPDNTFSSNMGYGIEVTGHARNNLILHTRIGSNSHGTAPLGNARGGILLGRGSSGTSIGAAPLPFAVDVLFNDGSGVTILSSKHNSVVGDQIFGDAAFGVLAVGNCKGSVIRGSTIASNGQGNVNITHARGVTYIA